MKVSTVVAPLGGRALLAAVLAAGCAMDVDQPYGSDKEMLPGSDDDGAEPDEMETSEPDDVETDEPDDAESGSPESQVTSPCALGAPGVYSPFAAPGSYPSGPVDELPWTGAGSYGQLNVYPAGDE